MLLYNMYIIYYIPYHIPYTLYHILYTESLGVGRPLASCDGGLKSHCKELLQNCNRVHAFFSPLGPKYHWVETI